MSRTVLEIKNLTKCYKPDLLALDDISFSVSEGQFFGLLGPNGAGKSTLINIITSLVPATSGAVSIYGYDVKNNAELAKTYLGLVPQEFNFNIFEPLIQILINQGGYYGVPYGVAKERSELLLKQCGLYQKRFMTAGTLSGGMKRRLMIARSMVHQPKILILDEPTAGVDIALRREMWTFLQELSQSGVTIILTTHYLEEAEYLCNDIGIINEGNLITLEPTKTLLEKLHSEIVILYCETLESFSPTERFSVTVIDETILEVELSKDQSITELLAWLSSLNVKVKRMKNKTNRLEEIFLRLTNE